MNRNAKTAVICAAVLLLAGAAVTYALIARRGGTRAFDGREVMRIDGQSGFSTTIGAAHKLFADLYAKAGIEDPFKDNRSVCMGDFNSVVARDGNAYRLKSMTFALCFISGSKAYVQHFDISDSSVSSFLMTCDSLPGNMPEALEFAVKLDAMDMDGYTEKLPGFDAYSIERLESTAEGKPDISLIAPEENGKNEYKGEESIEIVLE